MSSILAPLERDEHLALSQTGRGTPMGELLRRYWVPALLSEELPSPGGPPVRVRLLGEDLVAFRTPSGEIGLIAEFCTHRGASLYFGKNEEGGLRCCYHGWKYDVSGRCIEMPNEPAESTFKDKVFQTAYPCREAAGIVWAYLGAGTPGELPELEYLELGDSKRYVSKRLQTCNWVQALEVDIDSSHVPWLHNELLVGRDDRASKLLLTETAPVFEISEESYGLMIGARRDAGDGFYWRINHWLMPWFTVVPQGGGPDPFGIHAWVPIDDETCWIYSLTWHPDRDLTVEERETWKRGGGLFASLIPGTYIPRANKENDWLIDREAQLTTSLWSGISGNQEQDDAIAACMGPIYDRTKEHLIHADSGVAAVRRYLLNALERVEAGEQPPGYGAAAQRAARSLSIELPRETDWRAAFREHVEAAFAAAA